MEIVWFDYTMIDWKCVKQHIDLKTKLLSDLTVQHAHNTS